jgi:MFS family permease
LSKARIGWGFGALLVLASSGIVLVAEIVAARVIAPYVGITLETFSAVIGCVLAGISLGSWIGGWLADRVPTRLLVVGALGLGGASLVASPYIVRVIGPGVTPSDPGSAVALAVTAFLLPAVSLSAVTPTVLKAIGEGSPRLGSIAGSISAIGTAGALIGNFAAGFILVGTLRSAQILVACGSLCLILATVALFAIGGNPSTRATRSAAAAVLLLAAVVGSQLGRQLPCDAETEYVCLNIEQTAPNTYLIRSNIYSSSVTNSADPTYLAFPYVREIVALVAAAIDPAAPDVSFGYVGGGGYTLPLYFEATYPESSHLVYEIDGDMVDRVTTMLGIDDREERFPTSIGDARVGVAVSEPQSLDVVVGDAFSGISVPWHLTTTEFLEDIDGLLKPGGLYVMNLIDYDHYDLARAEARTFQAVFDDVVVVAPEFVLSATSGAGSNILLIGGSDLPDVNTLTQALANAGSGTTAIAGRDLEAFIGGEIQLTDDFAPVDQLLGRP